MRILLLTGLTACAAIAQTLTEPPPLLRFYRHRDAPSIRPYAENAVPVNVVGMSAVTGRAETWLIELHDSFASVEDVDKSLQSQLPAGAADEQEQTPGDILGGSTSLIAVYRQGLSYRPEQAVQALRTARYCQVSIYQVRPGSEQEFADLGKSRRVLFDSINLDRPDIAYYVLSGALSGIYVFLAPLNSLKVLDEALAKAPAFAENAAAESPKSRGFTREYLLFRVDPALSSVSEDFAGPDLAFWHPNAKKK